MSGTRGRIGVSVGLVVLTCLYITLFGGQVDTASLNLIGLVVISGMLMLTIFLAALRLQFAAADLGHRLRYRDCLSATIAGNAAGYFVFQLVGQIAARRLVLGRLGVSVDTAALATMYERFVALGVALAMAIAGGAHLFGKFGFDLRAGGQDLISIVVSLVIVVAVACGTIWRRPIIEQLLPQLNMRLVRSFARLTIVTILIQGCTLIAFVLAARQFGSRALLEDLTAASAIVMFAAAIPISFAGWGMRELSAVAALGTIGMSAGSAMSAAVLIGLLSLLTVSMAAALMLTAARAPSAVSLASPPVTSAQALRNATVWTLPLVTALLMFIQVRAPITGGFVTLSMADLFATVSGTVFLLNVATDAELRRLLRIPIWFVCAGTLFFLVSYINGVLSFGSTQWATSKLIGWFLLLAYMATGATIALYAGAAGMIATALTILTAMATIAAMDALTHYPSLANMRWDGLAGNPNAFAFQLAICFAVTFAMVRQWKYWPPLAALLLAASYFSLSRSGTFAILLIFCLGLAFRIRHWRRSTVAAVICVAVIFVWSFDIFALLPDELVKFLRTHGPASIGSGPGLDIPIREITGLTFSDTERWKILQNAWDIFARQPLTGAGLGFYYNHFTRPDGSSLVIHSTPLWLLAEFGIFGTLVFATFGLLAFVMAVKRAFRGHDGALMFFLTAIVFLVMGAIQDVFYQRTMWFVAGLSLSSLLTQGAVKHWRKTTSSN